MNCSATTYFRIVNRGIVTADAIRGLAGQDAEVRI